MWLGGPGRSKPRERRKRAAAWWAVMSRRWITTVPGTEGQGLVGQLGACRTCGVEAKFGPSEDSFRRICSPIAVAMGQTAGEKWTAAAKLQPTFPKSDRLLG